MKGLIYALVFTTVWFLASWGPQFSRNTKNSCPIHHIHYSRTQELLVGFSSLAPVSLSQTAPEPYVGSGLAFKTRHPPPALTTWQ